ncbi:MAG TPA: hypothetical protein GX519_05235 [Thermoanaerobacterales bacterium]|nr:hypothetical protein [Thermoanaerobacterales bacterium]
MKNGWEIWEHLKNMFRDKNYNDASEILRKNFEYPIIEKVMRALTGSNIEFIYLLASDDITDQICCYMKASINSSIFYSSFIQTLLNIVEKL